MYCVFDDEASGCEEDDEGNEDEEDELEDDPDADVELLISVVE